MVARARPAYRGYDIEDGVPQTGGSSSAQLDTPQNHALISASTEGLWQFNSSLADLSANSPSNEMDFVRARGASDVYREGIIPGVKALVLDGAKEYKVEDQTYNIKGDISGAVMVRSAVTQINKGLIVAFRGDDDLSTEAHNPQWSIDMWTTARKLRWLQKDGDPGTSRTHEVDYLFPVYEWVHLGWRRASQKIQFFLDGTPWGPESAALTAPTGGTSGWLQIGSFFNGGGDFTGELQSLLIQSEALTDSDFRSLARRFKPWLP